MRTRGLPSYDSPWKLYHIPPTSRVIGYNDIRPKRTDTLDILPNTNNETLSGPPDIIGDEAGAITAEIAEEANSIAKDLEARSPDRYRN